MKQTSSGRKLWLIGLLALPWMFGCSSMSVPSSSAVCPKIPPLPQEARPPAVPEICQPTCSAGVNRMFERLLTLPIPSALPPASAPGTTTPSP